MDKTILPFVLFQDNINEFNFKFFDIKSVEQFNHYYDDTDKSYNKSGITCRIREKNNDYVATVKYHRGRGYATEYKRKVINQYDCSLFSGMDIFYQGVLRTNRIVFEPVYGIKMMKEASFILMLKVSLQVLTYLNHYQMGR